MAGGKSRKTGHVSKKLVNAVMRESRRQDKAEREIAEGKKINELVQIRIKEPDIPEHWDFEQADKEFDELIRDWRRLTGDVICKLWIFYNKLIFKPTHKKGRPVKSELSDLLPTWTEWLESKGISDKTATSRFKRLGWIKLAEEDESPNIEKDDRMEIIAKLKKSFNSELNLLTDDELIVLWDNWIAGGKWWNKIFGKILNVLKMTQGQKQHRQLIIRREKGRKEYDGDMLVTFFWPDEAIPPREITPEERSAIIGATMTVQKKG